MKYAIYDISKVIIISANVIPNNFRFDGSFKSILLYEHNK